MGSTVAVCGGCAALAARQQEHRRDEHDQRDDEDSEHSAQHAAIIAYAGTRAGMPAVRAMQEQIADGRYHARPHETWPSSSDDCARRAMRRVGRRARRVLRRARPRVRSRYGQRQRRSVLAAASPAGMARRRLRTRRRQPTLLPRALALARGASTSASRSPICSAKHGLPGCGSTSTSACSCRARRSRRSSSASFEPWCTLSPATSCSTSAPAAAASRSRRRTIVPMSQVDATDVSSRALAVAADNVARHGVAAACGCSKRTCFRRLSQRYRVIVSNPPYVPEGEVADAAARIPSRARDRARGRRDGLRCRRADPARRRRAADGRRRAVPRGRRRRGGVRRGVPARCR